MRDPVSPVQPLEVLIVDDDPTCRLMAEAALGPRGGRRGLNATHAASVVQAVARLHDRRYDVVVVDLRLPDGSGYDVLRAIRTHRLNRGARVIAYTADTSVRRTDPRCAERFDAIAHKPFSYAQLGELAGAGSSAPLRSRRVQPAVVRARTGA